MACATVNSLSFYPIGRGDVKFYLYIEPFVVALRSIGDFLNLFCTV